MDGHSDPEVKNRLQHVAQSGFKRITYTEAIDILLKAIQDFRPQKKGDKLFEFEVRLALKSYYRIPWTKIPCPACQMPVWASVKWGLSAGLPASACSKRCFVFRFITPALLQQPGSPCSGTGWMHLGSAWASRTARLMKGIKCNPSVMSIAGFHKERKKVRKGLCLPGFTGEKPKGKVYWVSLGSVRDSASGLITVVVSLFPAPFAPSLWKLLLLGFPQTPPVCLTAGTKAV